MRVFELFRLYCLCWELERKFPLYRDCGGVTWSCWWTVSQVLGRHPSSMLCLSLLAALRPAFVSRLWTWQLLGLNWRNPTPYFLSLPFLCPRWLISIDFSLHPSFSALSLTNSVLLTVYFLVLQQPFLFLILHGALGILKTEVNNQMFLKCHLKTRSVLDMCVC